MKIRNQFYILLLGILIVPALTLGVFGVNDYLRSADTTFVPGYKEISQIAGRAIDRSSWERMAGLISRKPANMDFVIMDVDSRVLFSTIAEYPQSSYLSSAQLIRLIYESKSRYLYQMDFPPPSVKNRFFVVSRIMYEEHRVPQPFYGIIMTLIILLLVIFLFTAIMSILIARSITNSVMILEKSTRRIAEGELDLNVEVKGSNEIISLTGSLNRMRLGLKEDQARRSRFIMGISHDLKTPLSLIKGYTEAIADGLADDPVMRKKSLEIIGNKVDRLNGMIDDLISFVKLDTGEWRRNLRDHAIAPLLHDFGKRAATDGNLLNRRIEYRIEIPDTVIVPLDERLFLRVLENISSNSLRYTREGGKIFINASLDGADIVISITDNGPGIAQEDVPHIFDLFYRGNNSRRDEGMGLGLSVVKSIADSHGWKIHVESEPDKGSTFTIIIPYHTNE
jgi:signal transduction histidine kinase